MFMNIVSIYQHHCHHSRIDPIFFAAVTRRVLSRDNTRSAHLLAHHLAAGIHHCHHHHMVTTIIIWYKDQINNIMRISIIIWISDQHHHIYIIYEDWGNKSSQNPGTAKISIYVFLNALMCHVKTSRFWTISASGIIGSWPCSWCFLLPTAVPEMSALPHLRLGPM